MKCTLDQVHWVLGWTFFIKTRKIHFKLNYVFGDLLALAGVCKTKTKRRKIEIKCTYSSVCDTKNCIQEIYYKTFNQHFCVFFLGKKMCNQERKTVTTQNTRLRFLNNYTFVALTGQSFFSFEPSFSSFFCLLSFFSSFSRVLFFSFDSLISSSFSSSFCF